MSAILTILGRATRDPEMQQGKNSGTEYVSLDIAVSQRGQDGKEETIYYQCYFNKFLAERLAKAGVKKGTGLMIYGDLELHPFIYQKGKNAGQANAGPRINVKDWHFVPSNRSDSNTGHPGANQNSQPNGGAATPGAAGNGSYPMHGNGRGSIVITRPLLPVRCRVFWKYPKTVWYLRPATVFTVSATPVFRWSWRRCVLDKNGRTGELPFGAPLHLKEEPGTCASGSAEDTV